MANTSKRGFASMDSSKQREIASKGGRAAHAKGTAHEFTSDEARVAGRKGGEAVSRDRAHMSAIGREGGHSRGRARQAQAGGNGSINISSNSSSLSSDTERSYIGTERANDGGSANTGDRNATTRSNDRESNREGHFSGRGQL
jgi:general stress protein YciG